MEQTATVKPGAITPGSLYQSSLDAEKDRPRGRPLVYMRIKNRNTLGLQIMGTVIGPGEHIVEVYDDDAPKVLAMVEDQRLIEAANRQCDRDIAEELSGKVEHWQGTVDELLGLIQDGSNERVNDAYKLVMQTTAHSPQASFQALNKRGMRSLDAAEVIPGSEHPEPQRAAVQSEVDKHAKAQAEALRIVAREIVAELKGTAAPANIDALVEAKVKQILNQQQGGQQRR